MPGVARSRGRDMAGAACGVAAGTVALAVAQVGGKFVDGAVPPLQALGDLVIRVTPVSVTEALIRQVGRSDKLVLLICILVVASVAAAVVGLGLVRGRVRPSLVGIGLLALLPGLAAADEAAATLTGELVTLVPAALLGAGVLWVLGAPLLQTKENKAPIAPPQPGLERRQLLRAALVLSASAAVGTTVVRRLSRPSVALMARLRGTLPTPLTPLAPLTDELASFGASPLTTALDSFYRIDTALSPPLVDPEGWSLTLSQDGKKLAAFTYDELLAKATSQADITIGCVSNEVGGDLIGTARWQGVLLADLLKEAGVTQAGRIAGVSVDGFVASFPGAYAFDGRPAMVAVGMNGAVLPVLHGFPARLVVPGLYGYTSATKWLQAIDVSDSTDLPGFWADRGWTAAVTVHLTSRIDTPRHRSNVAAGPVTLAGVAWAPLAGVGTVEVQIDDGAWQAARLSTAVSGTVWRQWVLNWHATPGRHRVRVRATDADGRKQDTRHRPVYPSGATGLHTLSVTVS